MTRSQEVSQLQLYNPVLTNDGVNCASTPQGIPPVNVSLLQQSKHGDPILLR